MKPFCEIIVSDVLPGLRSILTNELSETYGMTQTQISKKLGMTQPAISQYMRKLRGRKVKIISSNKKIMAMIKELAKDISTKDVDSKHIHKKICEICKTVRKESLICKIHEKSCPSLKSCRLCFE